MLNFFSIVANPRRLYLPLLLGYLAVRSAKSKANKAHNQ